MPLTLRLLWLSLGASIVMHAALAPVTDSGVMSALSVVFDATLLWLLYGFHQRRPKTLGQLSSLCLFTFAADLVSLPFTSMAHGRWTPWVHTQFAIEVAASLGMWWILRTTAAREWFEDDEAPIAVSTR